MNAIRKLSDLDQQYVQNVLQAQEATTSDEINRLLLEFADYLTTDYGNIKVVYPDGVDIERTSMMMSSRYLKHPPEQYINALKIDYLFEFDDDGAANTRSCLRYALRLIPKTYPDVITMEQDSALRKELMANIEALEIELRAFDAYKEMLLSLPEATSQSANGKAPESTESVSLLSRFFKHLFS